MKQWPLLQILGVIFSMLFLSNQASAQAKDYIFKDTILNVNFGTRENPQVFDFTSLKNYKRNYSNCPDDGYYAYASESIRCFSDTWISMSDDHTPGDQNGNMMIVNAAKTAGTFCLIPLKGLKKNTTYEVAVWMINICKIKKDCPPLSPNIIFKIESAKGKLVEFRTGNLAQSNDPYWTRFSGIFTTLSDVSSLMLKMTNITKGGCGNDFVLDDVTFRECVPAHPKVPPVINNKVRRTMEKFEDTANALSKNLLTMYTTVMAPRSRTITVPAVLQTRENAMVDNIRTGDGEYLIEFYDNGSIDGDTVSIYHNNQLIVSNKELSEKPISFKIKIDSANTFHDIILVAENLGSIPPNTSLMVVTLADKRYEIFVSSTQSKNAKIVIERKE